MGILIFLGFLSVVFFIWFSPRVFSFYANVSAINNDTSGKVFKSSDGIFVVRLDSGTQLTVQQNPPKVFLSPSSKMKGFSIDNFLVLPTSAIGGIDLSQSEGFSRQVPLIKDGMVILKDPMKQNGVFSFPLNK